MQNTLRIVLTLVVCLLVTGCGASISGSSGLGNKSVQVVTSEEMAKEAIYASPLKFVVPPEEVRTSWERATFFSRHFLNSEPKIELRGGSEGGSIVLNTNSQNFGYTVVRQESVNGGVYEVACLPTTPQVDATAAEQNARNLARFLKEGKLEVTLLQR